MAAPSLLRGNPLLRLRIQHHRLAAGLFSPLRQPFCTSGSTAESTTRFEENKSTAKDAAELLRVKEPPKFSSEDHLDSQELKAKEAEISRDIEPLIHFAKDIIHSDRYMDGERLDAEDEGIVLHRFLAYHPRGEDKIGCGLDSIMVDRHPQFKNTRCMFVVRTDGGWIDFSYQKCLREYIRNKYPSHADRFIKKYFKRGSG